MAEDLRLIANGGNYTESGDDNSDSTGLLTATASKLSINALSRNTSTLRYKSGSFSTNFYAEGTVNVSSSSGSSGRLFECGFTDTIGNRNSWVNAIYTQFLIPNSATTTFYASCVAAESSAVVGYTTGSNIFSVGATVYYYRTGRLSCFGGANGAVFTQVFSDSGRTALLQTVFGILTANPTLNYFTPAATSNDANAAAITAYNEAITLYSPSAGANLTLGTETDTPGKLSVYADCIVATGLDIINSEAASHVALDYGTDFFGDYKISGVLYVDSFTNGSAGVKMFSALTLTNSAADALAATVLQGIAVEYYSAGSIRVYIQENIGGTPSYSTNLNVLTQQLFSYTLARSGSTLTLKLYNDLVLDSNLDGVSLVNTITWTGRATTPYRYLMPVTTSKAGATSRTSTFTIGGVRALLGVSSYSITSAGGAVTGGSSTIKIGQKVLASGGAVSGGSSTILLGQKVLSTGGGVLGGIATQYGTYAGTASYSITSSGGMVAGGASIINLGLKLSSTGGMVIGGSATISVAYAPGLSEYVYTESVVDSTGTPITGASSKTSIFLKNVETGDIMDWSDVTMKSSGWGSITDVLSETIYPAGEYGYTIPLSGLANGRYCATLKYTPTIPSSTDPIQTFQVEFYVIGGYVVDQYVSNRLDMTITALPAGIVAADDAAIIEGTHTRLSRRKRELAKLIGDATQPVGTEANPNADGSYSYRSPVTGEVQIAGTIIAGVRTVTTPPSEVP